MFTLKQITDIAAIINDIENPAHKINMWSEFEHLIRKNNDGWAHFDESGFAKDCGIIQDAT